MTSLLLALTLAAPVPKDFKKPVPVLNGSWQLTGLEFNGAQLGGNQNSIWRFQGDSLTIEYPDRGIAPSTQPITTDSKSSPKGFQFANNGNRLGIYEVTGNGLVICLGQQPGVRPANAVGGPNVIRYLFTRISAK